MAVMNSAFQMYQFSRPNISIEKSDAENRNQHNSDNAAAASNNAYQQYQQNMINTASPQELTLMLYNGLLKFLKLGIQGIEEGNIEKSNNNIIRAQDIIYEFMYTLDMNYEISQNLMALYDYMNRRLIEANLKKDKAIIEEVVGFAEELRDTWAQAMKLAKQQAVNK